MLTVDFARLGALAGSRVIDIGCGAGRHAFEAYRRGARVVAFDQDRDELESVQEMFEAMAEAGEAPPGAEASISAGDALDLPFADDSFDVVIASEILEHIPEDDKAIWEIARIARPGALIAVTVPGWLPERVCWALSAEYHQVEGGHVRIYQEDELLDRLGEAGLRQVGRHRSHALHSAYWWLKCLVGPHREGHPLVGAYHRLLVWDMLQQPALTRTAEWLLDPVLGKSLAVYLVKE